MNEHNNTKSKSRCLEEDLHLETSVSTLSSKKVKREMTRKRIKELEDKLKSLKEQLAFSLHTFPLELQKKCEFLLNSKLEYGKNLCKTNKSFERKAELFEFPTFNNELGFVLVGTQNNSAYAGQSAIVFFLSNTGYKESLFFKINKLDICKKSTISHDVDNDITYEIAKYFIQKYIECFYPFFPIIEYAVLLKRLDLKSKTNFYCSKMPKLLFYSIIAASFTNSDTDMVIDGVNLGKLSCDCYEVLVDNWMQLSIHPSITNLQTLLHFVVAMNPRNRYSYWVHTGTIVKMAYCLNLNKNCYIEKHKYHELYRKIWWACYIVDKFAMLIFGRSSMIKENDYDTNEILIDKSSSTFRKQGLLKNSMSVVSSQLFGNFYCSKISQLCRILDQILSSFYLIEKASCSKIFEIKERAKILDKKLEEWFFDFEDLKSRYKRIFVLSDKSAVVFAYFYTCKILIYKRIYSLQTQPHKKLGSLDKMLQYADNIKVLITENIKSYTSCCSLYKGYPLNISISVYMAALMLYKNENMDNQIITQQTNLFNMLKLYNRFGLQDYHYKTFSLKIVEKLYEEGILLSKTRIDYLDSESIALKEIFKGFEENLKIKTKHAYSCSNAI